MPSKLFPALHRRSRIRFLGWNFVLLAIATSAFSAENLSSSPAKFVGMNSCSSSSCHGGAGEKSDECVIWSKKDFHSRAFATLTTARSERMAEVLGIKSPVKDAKCTICHAPFQTVPKELQANPLDVTKGVSCESCHAPAENWLRSHTRRDFTHADRVNAGMRDLKNLYVRANTCVACHQNISTNLLAASHPELIFELDGQAVSEPKHWAESTNWNGAQAWFVGQAVALREMSWQLAKTPSDTKLREKWNGLLWLLAKIQGEERSGSQDANQIQQWSDDLTRKAASREWSPDLTAKILESISKTSGDFKRNDIAPSIQARRAERLVLGLDRLIDATDLKLKQAADSELDKLFSLVQSLPDFDPPKFAEALEKFSGKLSDSR